MQALLRVSYNGLLPQPSKLMMSVRFRLPAPTKIVMSMSDFVSGMGGLFTLILGISSVIGFGFALKKSYPLKKAWHQAQFKLPIFCNLIKKSILAKSTIVSR